MLPSGLPGPRVRDALPLDELAHHAAAPLLWYAVVWAAAGILVGAYARWARIERLTASLPLALVVGVFVYVATGTSIAVVRQIPAGQYRGTGSAKLVQRKEIARRPRNREADDVPAPPAVRPGRHGVGPLQQPRPIHSAGRFHAPGDEAPPAHLSRDQPLGFENFVGG